MKEYTTLKLKEKLLANLLAKNTNYTNNILVKMLNMFSQYLNKNPYKKEHFPIYDSKNKEKVNAVVIYLRFFKQISDEELKDLNKTFLETYNPLYGMIDPISEISEETNIFTLFEINEPVVNSLMHLNKLIDQLLYFSQKKREL